MSNHEQLLAYLKATETLTAAIDTIIAVGQDPRLFELRKLKFERFIQRKNKVQHFFKRTVNLGPILKNLTADNFRQNVLPIGFINSLTAKLDFYKESLRGSIVVLQNNDFSGATEDALEAYRALYSASTETVFAIWDTDNHHWVNLSTLLATYSDYYIPAHPVLLDLYSKYTDHLLEGVYSGSIQWTKKYLLENFEAIRPRMRKPEPFGKHGFYPKFAARNTVIATLNTVFPDVSFSDPSYATKTEQERLKEWLSYRYHFIAPVNNDLPYRLFDAIVTGGTPLVPNHYKFFFESVGLEDIALYYDVDHLYNPNQLKQMIGTHSKEPKNLKELNFGTFASLLNKFHADWGLNQILKIVEKKEEK